MAAPAASPTLSILSLPTSEAASFDLMSASDDEVILVSDMSAPANSRPSHPNANTEDNNSFSDAESSSRALSWADSEDDEDFVLVPEGRDLMDERMRSLIPNPRPAPQLLPQHPDTIASILRPAILSAALFDPRPIPNPTILSLARLSLEETLPKRAKQSITKHKVGGTSKPTRGVRVAKVLVPTPSALTTATTALTKRQRKKAKKAKKAAKTSIPTSVPVETSEDGSESDSSEEVESRYEAARRLLNDYLDNPAQAGISPLHILRALIIELGLTDRANVSTLPSSIKQARLLIKSKALINIQDYVAKREQGLQALRSVMFNSKSALRKDVRKRTVPIGWVKERGLSMLLVPVFR